MEFLAELNTSDNTDEMFPVFGSVSDLLFSFVKTLHVTFLWNITHRHWFRWIGVLKALTNNRYMA